MTVVAVVVTLDMATHVVSCGTAVQLNVEYHRQLRKARLETETAVEGSAAVFPAVAAVAEKVKDSGG